MDEQPNFIDLIAFTLQLIILLWIIYGPISNSEHLLVLYLVFVPILMMRYMIDHRACSLVSAEYAARSWFSRKPQSPKDTFSAKVLVPIYTRPCGQDPVLVYGVLSGLTFVAARNLYMKMTKNK